MHKIPTHKALTKQAIYTRIEEPMEQEKERVSPLLNYGKKEYSEWSQEAHNG